MCENTTQVDVAVVVVERAHAHLAAVQRVTDRQVPRGVDLAGGGVNDDGADMSLAVDAREVAGHEEATVGQGQEGLDLIVEVESLAGPIARIDVEGRQAARRVLGTVLALLDAGEVTADVHGGADLLEGLDLNGSFRVGAVDVPGYAPRGCGRVVRDGAGHGGASLALVRDAGEGRGVGGDARTHVGLRVGEDRLAVLAEEGRGRTQVATPVSGTDAVSPTDSPAGACRRVELEGVPALVVAEGIPQEAGDGTGTVHRDAHRVSHLEGPHEVRHLGELQVQLLVGAARGAPRAQDAHAVRLVLDVFIVEQAVDSVVGELNDVEGRLVTLARCELRRIAIAAAPRLPAFAATADHDPAAAICGLITEELGGGVHRGGLEPVGAVLRVGIALLDVPARGRCGGGAQTVAKDGLTGGNGRWIAIICVRHRGERKRCTRDNRRRCKGYKARKCGSHDTAFQRDNNLVALRITQQGKVHQPAGQVKPSQVPHTPLPYPRFFFAKDPSPERWSRSRKAQQTQAKTRTERTDPATIPTKESRPYNHAIQPPGITADTPTTRIGLTTSEIFGVTPMKRDT